MTKKWIDLCTMAVPRLMTETCIRSFMLSWADRDDYRVRWLYHLDAHPLLGKHYHENRAQALRCRELFDDSILLVNRRRRYGYTEAVHRLMERVELCRDVLWIEDDWFWINRWRLAPIDEFCKHYVNFYCWRRIYMAGGTSPSFWRYPMIENLLKRLPWSAYPVTFNREVWIKNYCRRAGFRTDKPPKQVVRPQGIECGKLMGTCMVGAPIRQLASDG